MSAIVVHDNNIDVSGTFFEPGSLIRKAYGKISALRRLKRLVLVNTLDNNRFLKLAGMSLLEQRRFEQSLVLFFRSLKMQG